MLLPALNVWLGYTCAKETVAPNTVFVSAQFMCKLFFATDEDLCS